MGGEGGRLRRNMSRMRKGGGRAPGPEGPPTPVTSSPPLLFSPPLSAPRLPVAERQVPATRAPQAPQHRVQRRRRIRPSRPLAGRERSAGEILSRLQPALLLGRSRERRLQRRVAGRARSPPPRHGSLTAALGSAMTAPGRAARLTALPWRRGRGKRAGPAGSAATSSEPRARPVSAPSLPSGQSPPPPRGASPPPTVSGRCAGAVAAPRSRGVARAG